MVAGKWAPVPPFFFLPGRWGEEGGKMAAPEQNNTGTLTFYINLLTRVWVLFKSEAWCSPLPRWAEPAGVLCCCCCCLNLLYFHVISAPNYTSVKLQTSLSCSREEKKQQTEHASYLHTVSALINVYYLLFKTRVCKDKMQICVCDNAVSSVQFEFSFIIKAS